MKTVFSLSLIFLLAFNGALFAQSFSAEDFLAPVQAATTANEEELRKIKDPQAVKEGESPNTGQKAIMANSQQDALNAFVKQKSVGFTEIIFPSGFGFAAKGVAVYQIHESNVTTRIDKRNAYAKAYIDATNQLAQALYGLPNEAKTKISELTSTVDTSNQATLTNSQAQSNEKIQQSLDNLIRGYVVYDVMDDVENNTVSVTIVTSPKTQGHYERPDPNTLVADSILNGLNEVVAETKNALVPPIGGKTIFVPSTGEIAFVGFGSAVVTLDADKALQAKHNLNAEKMARIRATNSLSEIINGNRVLSSVSIENQTLELVKDYDEITKNSSLNKVDIESKNFQALAERKKEFLNNQTFSSTVTNISKGTIPPGVKVEGWLDDQNAFAYGIAVYIPSLTDQAQKAQMKMLEGTINQSKLRPMIAQKLEARSPEPLNAAPVTQGPTGQVQSNDAL
jgi:hypothetical protein